jgi:pectin methylesterase-like acyl-CoA thioesterase
MIRWKSGLARPWEYPRRPRNRRAVSQTAVAGTLCVNPAGSHNCFKSIQTAVNHAAANDLIQVEAGTYNEEVAIGLPVAIIGAGASASIIDANGLAHGIFVDGFDHPGLRQVTIKGLTVENALFEGVLIVSASDITIQDNSIIDNDTTPGLSFTGALTRLPGPAW